jgi:hypothetical protein
MTRVGTAPTTDDERQGDRIVIEYVLGLVRDGYLAIDDEGHVWRRAIKKRSFPHGRVEIPVRRAENPSGKGYLRITIVLPGQRRTQSIMAHRVVWEWANGPIPDDLQINHKDLNKQNNRLSNLELVTASGNIQHSYAHGRPHPWRKVRKDGTAIWRGRPVLTDERIREMCAMQSNGATVRQVAQAYGYSWGWVQRVTSAMRKSLP